MRTTWTMKITGADADPNTSPYSDVTTADIITANGYTNNTSVTVYITAPQFKWVYPQVAFDGSEGALRRYTRRRKSWEVVMFPFTYAAGSNPDLDDIDTLSAVLAKRYLWINIQAGDRNYPSTTTKSMPVVLDGDTQDSINTTSGRRTLTASFLHAFLES